MHTDCVEHETGEHEFCLRTPQSLLSFPRRGRCHRLGIKKSGRKWWREITMRCNIHIYMFQYKRLLRNYIVTSAYHRRAQSILQKPLHRPHITYALHFTLEREVFFFFFETRRLLQYCNNRVNKKWGPSGKFLLIWDTRSLKIIQI